MKGTAFGLLLLGLLASPAVSAKKDCGAEPAAPPSGPRALDLYSQVPLHFEPNQGQADPQVRFVARGAGYALLLTPRESIVALRAPKRKGESRPAEIVRIALVGANPAPSMEGADLLPGRANYLVGGESSRWRTDIPLYERVRLSEVYPGIGLTYYGNQRQLEYDFDVAPGADPRAIRLRVEGAKSLRLDAEGNLRIRARHGELVQHAPVVYQVKAGARQPVPGHFRLRGKREVQFDVPRYDRTAALVIDPVMQWSVYLGGNGDDTAKAVAAEDRSPNFNTFVAGTTLSTNFCVFPAAPPRATCSFQADRPQTDAFVTKFRYTTSPLNLFVDFSTYLGGDGNDEAEGIALQQPNGLAHVAGFSDSATGFPGGPTYGGGTADAWVVGLNSTGNGLLYVPRFIGGNGHDVAYDLVVSDQGDAYVVGQTSTPTGGGFPLVGGPFQSLFGGVIDAFLTKVSSSGNITYSTYYGGGAADRANAIALRDVAGVQAAVYFVGETGSTNFPLTNEFQSTLRGPSDAFAVKLDDSGAGVSQAFSSYLGGAGLDIGFGVDIDPVSSFDFYVAGQTGSDDFPVTADAFQKTRGGMNDGFVTKIKGGASPFVYSTYLGGSQTDLILGIAVDAANHAHVTGQTSSADFPVFRPLSVGPVRRGPDDAFVTKIVPQGCAVLYSTYLGGTGNETGTDLAVLGSSVSVVGRTTSTDSSFPVQFPPTSLAPAVYGSFQGGTSDAFVTSITDAANADVQVSKVDSPDPVAVGQELTYTVTLRNLSTGVPAYGIRLTDTLPVGVTFVSVTPGAPSCSEGAGIVTCDIPCLAPSPGPRDKVDVVIKVIPTTTGSKTNTASITTPYLDPTTPGANNASAITTVTQPVDLMLTKDVAPVYPAPVPVGGNVTYTITVRNNSGAVAATGVKVIDTMPAGIFYTSAIGGPFVCTPAPPASVVTCTLSAPLPPLSQQSFQITGQATAPGVQTNTATASGNEGDPVPGNDSGTADTLVTVPGTAALFPTVRSSGAAASIDPANQNFLEWLNPGGPASQITIHRTTAAGLAPCAYETNSGNAGTRLAAATRAFVPNQKESFLDDNGGGGLTNFTTYCYTIFVEGVSPRFISGRPFDAVNGAARWGFNMGTWSMAPPGNGVGMMHAVSNDNVLYAMTKGATGGQWPGPAPQWLPYGFMAGPSQGRPSTYPLPVGTAPSAVLLSSQDGNVYAINAQMGGGASPAWPPSFLGTTALAHPSAMFRAFGAAEDLIYAASRETPPTESTFFGLRLSDGTTAAPGWSQSAGGADGKIGPVHGQPAVDYFTSPPKVYFATRQLDAVNTNTLWCLNAVTGAVIWAKPYGDIDAGVTLRGDRLYVATNSGTVQAIDKNTGDPAWTISGAFTIMPPAEGPAKGFVYAPPGSSELFFASRNRIWFLSDGLTSYLDNWPGGVPVSSPATPIKVPGETRLYVGSGDGTLQRRDAATGFFVDAYVLGDLKASVGSPTFDLRNGFIYVGTEAGIIYAINKASAGDLCVVPSQCASAADGTPCSSTAPVSCFCTCLGGVCVGGC